MSYSRLKRLLSELKRRHVYRVAVIYVAAGFALLQGLDIVLPALEAPAWVLRASVITVLAGFPVALTLSWIFDLTRGGIERTDDGSVAAAEESQADSRERDESIPSLAVLPFGDLSPEGDQAYFCEGMAEEIMNALVRVEGIRVTSRKSAFQFKAADGDIRMIGRRLGVNSILEGNVRKAANRLRVTVQLVDVERDRRIWSEKYDREMEDVFAVQDEIAQQVVEALEVTLGPRERHVMGRPSTRDLQAYDYYLRGRHYFYRWGKKNIEFAIQMFSRAIELDPGYALAYTGIADCHAILYSEFGKDAAHLAPAREASQKAVELDPEAAEAHTSRGIALALSDQYDDAAEEFETAIALNGRLFEAHYFYARVCFIQGELAGAARHYEDAARVRPEDYQAPALLGTVYGALGLEQEAAAARERALHRIEKHLELNPDDVRATYFGAGSLVKRGERDRGLEWARRALEMDPDDPETLYNVACVYSLAGEAEAAIECLEKTLELGMAKSRAWVNQDSDFDPIRDQPAFQAFVEQLK